MNTPVDLFCLLRYTRPIDRKKLLPLTLMILLLATYSFAPFLIVAVCVVLLADQVVCALIEHDDPE
jgi:hypothetical protein